jgi:hypothetical protein
MFKNKVLKFQVNLEVFLVDGKTFVHLEDFSLEEVIAEDSVFVDEVCDRSLDANLAGFGALAVAIGQPQLVLFSKSEEEKVSQVDQKQIHLNSFSFELKIKMFM